MLYYRDLKVIFLLLGVGFPLSVILLQLAYGIMPGLFLMAICWEILYAVICNQIAFRRMRALNALLLEECKVQAFLEGVRALYDCAKLSNWKRPMRLNIASGLLAAGEAKEALIELEAVGPRLRRSGWKLIYWRNMISAFVQLQQYETARECLAHLKNMLNQSRLRKPLQVRAQTVYLVNEKILAFAEGQTEGIEAFFLEQLAKETVRYHQVVFHTYLAKLYLQTGETQKALPHLRFAAEYGGDTIYAKQAKALEAEFAGKAILSEATHQNSPA